MENQHRRIVGYRELNQGEIDLMNAIKAKGVELGVLIQQLDLLPSPHPEFGPDQVTVDHRWLAIGRTHLQEGLMALTRAVAKPEFF